MLAKLNTFFQSSFSILLLLGLLIGLLFPAFAAVPSHILLVILALTIFVSCFQVSWNELRDIPGSSLLVFYCIRFLCLPVCLYFMFLGFSPLLAVGAFLYSSMPTGVSAPAVTQVCQGNVAVSLVLLACTSILTPFIVPALMAVVVDTLIEIDSWGLFRTLLFTLLLPLLLHLPVRISKSAKSNFKAYGSIVIIPLIFSQVVVVVARQREYILANLTDLPIMLLIAVSLFAIFYTLGWFFSKKHSIATRKAFALSSGVNNSIMAIVVSSVYFPDAVTTLLVVCQLCWVTSLALCNASIGRIQKSK